MLRAVLAAVILLVLPFAAQAQDERARCQERGASVDGSIAREAIERKVLAGVVVIAVHGSDTLLAVQADLVVSPVRWQHAR